MINLERDIHSLTDFKRNTNDFVQQMKETQSPLVLTVNGKAEIVVQDVASYQAMLARQERQDTIEGIQRGLEQMARGEGRSAEEVFAEFRAKHGLPNG